MSAETIHAPRRTPREAPEPFDLHAAATTLLAQAHDASAGRAARNLTPGHTGQLSQTLLALVRGEALQEHVAPGPATLQVLHGSARLRHGDAEVSLAAGTWATIPAEVHSLEADEDVVVLLTVAPTASARAD